MVKLICKITKNQSKPSGLIQIFVRLSSECDLNRVDIEH